MSTHPGARIKSISTVVGAISAAFVLITGFGIFYGLIRFDWIDYYSSHKIWIGIIYVVLGLLFSYLEALLLYAFGQLVENSDTIVGLIGSSKANSTTDGERSEKKERFGMRIHIENEPQTIGSCHFCEKTEIPVQLVEVHDYNGYRKCRVCTDCLKKHKDFY